jgi:hypothetical protein
MIGRSQKVSPSVEFLKACLEYDFQTGVLAWKERPLAHFPDARIQRLWNGRYAGKRAGSTFDSSPVIMGGFLLMV